MREEISTAGQSPWGKAGKMVNPRIKRPKLPPWLDLTSCEGCGSLYKNHRGEYSWSQACNRIRRAAEREGDTGGGFRSRGPVLWSLHVLKVESWMMNHIYCDPSISDEEEQELEWDDSNPLF